MSFANIEYFLLLLLLIPYIWYMWKSKKKSASLLVADTSVNENMPKTIRVRLLWLPDALRVILFVLVVIILARPQTSSSWGKKETEGIDIMLTLDVSTTMLAQDLRPNRIEAAKEVAADFITNRENDNIGLTIFAGEAFTQCPMTTDHTSLLNMLASVKTDIVESQIIQDGTAIGMGLTNAISRLKDSQAKSKVVILLTDGNNNRGEISPLTAADIAKTYGIRVYTIAVGAEGMAQFPVNVGGTIQYVNMKADVDEKMLAEIASKTNAKTYRAHNARELATIYKDIDALEKSKLQVKKFSRNTDCYQIFAIIALLVFLCEVLFRQTVFKRLV